DHGRSPGDRRTLRHGVGEEAAGDELRGLTVECHQVRFGQDLREGIRAESIDEQRELAGAEDAEQGPARVGGRGRRPRRGRAVRLAGGCSWGWGPHYGRGVWPE